MPNALHNPTVERWLAEEPVVVDVSLGIIQAGYAAPAITCSLVPRAEGVVARFTIRGGGGPYDVYVSKGGYAQATDALMRAWGCTMFRAATHLANAERIAWMGLADRGVDVPADFID